MVVPPVNQASRTAGKFSSSRDEEERDVADKNKTVLSIEFPYQWNLLKLESYERPITDSFQGPIYWNDFHREVFAGLKAFIIHSGGQVGALTVRGLCEAILDTGYRPEEEQNIIGNVHVQMRVEDDTEALTIMYICLLIKYMIQSLLFSLPFESIFPPFSIF